VKYVQAQKPDKHNGGVFYEHEIHIDLTSGQFQITAKDLKEFLEQTIGCKHRDYRLKFSRGIWNQATKKYHYSAVVRFVDKDKAMMFKLGFAF